MYNHIMDEPLVSPPVSGRPGRWKNWLISGFVIEHLVLGLLLGIASFKVVQAYSEIGFPELDQQAREYTVGDKDALVKNLVAQALAQAPKLVLNTGQPVSAQFFIGDQDVNHLINADDFEYFDETYFLFQSANTLLLWIGVKDLEQPVMARTAFTYSPESGLDLTLKNVHLGPVPLPVRWFEFVAKTVEDTVNKSINRVHEQGNYRLTKVWSENGRLWAEVEVTHPEELITQLGSGLGF